MANASRKTHQALHTDQAPKPVGAYSQAIQTEGLIFLSGQVGLNPTTNRLVSDDVSQQTEQVMKNLEAVLKAANANLRNIVKTTIFLQDMTDFQTVNQIYASFFSNPIPPARSTIQVAGLPLGARVEIEAIAALPPTSVA